MRSNVPSRRPSLLQLIVALQARDQVEVEQMVIVGAVISAQSCRSKLLIYKVDKKLFNNVVASFLGSTVSQRIPKDARKLRRNRFKESI